MRAPSSTTVAPRNTTPGSRWASRSSCTVSSMKVDSGLSMVTPRPSHRARIRSPEDPLGFGQLRPVVDADRGRHVGGVANGFDGTVRPVVEVHKVRDPVLALGVVRLELRPDREDGVIEQVEARIHLADLRGLGVCGILLDDPEDPTALAAHDAPEPGRVLDAVGQQRHARPGSPVALAKPEERGRREQRGVAVQHKDIARKPGECLFGLEQGVPGAELLHLGRELDAIVAEARLDLLSPVADDHDDPFGIELGRGPEHVLEHRPSRHRVENLVQAGLHPGPFAGGENDDGETVLRLVRHLD